MRVRDRLAAVHAGVEDNPVAGLGYPLSCRHRIRLRRDFIQEPAAGGRERRKIGIVILWYDQDMHGRLRVYVTECSCSRALKYAGRRDIARGDAAEEAIGHIADLNL